MAVKTSPGYYWCILIVLVCTNVPFIVADLVYSNAR